MTTTPELALVYACSGCSSAAQLANHLAVRLDRAGDAEMSCIAGLGGDVKPLLRLARQAASSQRTILAIDGCALACVQHTLQRHGLGATHHLRLDHHGVRKALHADFDADQAEALLRDCRALLAEDRQARLRRDVPAATAPAPR